MAKRHILILDDKPHLARTIETILQNAGYEAFAYTAGEAALEAVKGSSPDLALIDVVLPERDGVDIAMEVRRLAPACKVLLISGAIAAAVLVDKARKRGFTFKLLLKPLPPAELLKEIQRELEGPHGVAVFKAAAGAR